MLRDRFNWSNNFPLHADLHKSKTSDAFWVTNGEAQSSLSRLKVECRRLWHGTCSDLWSLVSLSWYGHGALRTLVRVYKSAGSSRKTPPETRNSQPETYNWSSFVVRIHSPKKKRKEWQQNYLDGYVTSRTFASFTNLVKIVGRMASITRLKSFALQLFSVRFSNMSELDRLRLRKKNE